MRRLSSGILLLLTIPFAHAQSYVFFTFDPPGSTSTTVTGINNAGQIVGSFEDASGTHGFLRTGPTYTMIEIPGASAVRPAGINNRGEITGQFTGATGTHGFIRSAEGAYTVFDAPDLGLGTTDPRGINDRGEVVGNGFAYPFSNFGFLRSPDGSFAKIQLGERVFPMAINNAGEVAGSYWVGGFGGFLRGFVRSPQGAIETIYVPGSLGGQVFGINNTGQLVGSGFVRQGDGTFIAFEGPGPQTRPAGINDGGTIAGSYGVGSAQHGFLAVPSGTAPRPAIRSTRGVISASAYSSENAIAPGSWIEIYGVGLAKTARPWTAADFNGTMAPTSLDGVTVRINGQPAFIAYISPGQINALAPSTIVPGAARVTVVSDGQVSNAYEIEVSPVVPGVLAFPQTRLNSRDAVAIFPDNVTYALPPNSEWPVPSRFARAGDTLTFYGIGFGPVIPDVPAGRIATQLASLPSSLEILFNGVPGTIAYAGMAPGFVGLYQFNVIVPADAANDSNLAGVEFRFEGLKIFPSLRIGLAP